WMFEGKMLRGLTGTPMRRMARAKSSLADADPDPLTLANLTTKSLTAVIASTMSGDLRADPGGTSPGTRHFDQGLAHVPGSGRTSLRAQAAMEADILVLDHDPAGRQRVRDIEILLGIQRGRAQAGPEVFLGAVGDEADAVGRADVGAGVAFDAGRSREHGLDVAVQAALRLVPGGLDVEAEFDLDPDVRQGLVRVGPGDLEAVGERDLVVVAPLVDAHLLARRDHPRRRPVGDVLAAQQEVDRDGGVVAVRNRPDDVLGDRKSGV